MKIVVCYSCQAGGIGAALKTIFPQASVLMLLPSQIEQVRVELKDSNVFVTNQEMLDRLGVIDSCCRKIMVPDFLFAAFHPDICAAFVRSKREITKHHYNSLITAWGYSRGLEIAETSLLFRRDIFAALGYFDRWVDAVSRLQKNFELAGYTSKQFRFFFQKIKRFGLFCHSHNHPYPVVLVELAKLVAQQIDCTAVSRCGDIAIADGLLSTVWPVYPEIGLSYGLPGCFSWRIEHQNFHGINAFLEYTYEEYDSQCLGRQDLCRNLSSNDGFLRVDRIMQEIGVTF